MNFELGVIDTGVVFGWPLRLSRLLICIVTNYSLNLEYQASERDIQVI